MANFSKLCITDAGKRLLNLKLNAEEELLFTEMVMSERKYDMTVLEELTGLEGIRQRADIRKETRADDTIVVNAVFLNSGLEEGYFANTLGLYACLGEEEPVLFAVAVEQAAAAYMPAKSQTLSGMEFKLKITLENADQVTIRVDQSAMATVGDVLELENRMANHLADLDNPHRVSPAQLGIEEGANHYIHPDTHSAAMIDQDAGHRFVTDAQMQTWNGVYARSASYTDTQIAALINGAPGTLDTLGEIARAMQDNAELLDVLDAAIDKKADATHTHDGRYYTESEVNNLLGGKANSVHSHGNMANWEWKENGNPSFLWGSNTPGTGFVVSPNKLTVNNAYHIGNYNVDHILHSGKYGIMHSGALEHWATVKENGQDFVTYVTGCFQFVSPNLVNIYLDVLLRDGFGDKARAQHTHALSIETLKVALGVNTLSWDSRQSTADCILGPNAIAEIQGASMNTILLAMNTMFTDCFSGFRATADGRITRAYYDGSIHQGGNIYVCGPQASVMMRLGNIWRINIIGASYT